MRPLLLPEAAAETLLELFVVRMAVAVVVTDADVDTDDEDEDDVVFVDDDSVDETDDDNKDELAVLFGVIFVKFWAFLIALPEEEVDSLAKRARKLAAASVSCIIMSAGASC